tara:strand:- start:51 stop:236 length:186 start_codon:yes stop_codon:yes gene_type:complete
MTTAMNNYRKIEWIHSQLSELINGNDVDLLTMQAFVEDIRENCFDRHGQFIGEQTNANYIY